MYLTVKTIHIISSTILFGTGIGIAFFMFMANRQSNLDAIRQTAKTVVLADWLFTTTAVIVQPLSGYALIKLGGFPITQGWILWSIGLYFLAGACWLPVVWIQLKMKRIAMAAESKLPSEYYLLERAWCILGVPAFVSLVAVFYLMTAKPII